MKLTTHLIFTVAPDFLAADFFSVVISRGEKR
jgi:hypothetical protein